MSRPVLALSIAAVTVIGLSMTAWYISDNKDNAQVIPHHAGKLLAVTFAHADHTDQHCVACHHNFVDDTGVGLCFDCHKSDPEITEEIETQFHDLCRGCHIDNQQQGLDHGPTRACLACHTQDTRP